MTKTREQTLFRFEELSEKLRDEVRYRDDMMHSEMTADTSERLTGILEELTGCTVSTPRQRTTGDLEIEWSLGHSQGDGVAFYGTIASQSLLDALTKEDRSGGWVDDLSKISRNIDEALPLIRAMALHNVQITSAKNSYGNHYSHYNTMRFDVEAHGCDLLAGHPGEYTKLASDEHDEDECTFEVETWSGTVGDTVYEPTSGWNEIEELLRDISRYLEREGYEFLDALYEDDNLRYHYAGAWFDSTGRPVEWDEDDVREAHVAALEKADDERRAAQAE